MASVRKAMRFAHAEGHTDVCYNEEGTKIFTCGSDGDVRMWDSIEDEDPMSQCVGEIALAVAYKNGRFFVGTDSNNVQAYTYPESKRDGIICRFTAPVTHIVVSEDGLKLAAGSCDMEIQYVNLSNTNITKFTDHTAPILGVSLDPCNTFMASSSCDGTIKIRDIKSETVVKTLTNVIQTSNDFFRSTQLGRTSWSPDTGDMFVVPQDKTINVYERDTWSLLFTLFNSSIIDVLSIVSFSPCGNYLCGSSVKGEISVWDVDSRRSVSYTDHVRETPITSLAWHPTDDEIVFCDALGQLGLVCNPKSEKSSSTVPQSATSVDVVKEDVVVGDEDDDDDENVISIEKIKQSTAWQDDETSQSSHENNFRNVDFDKRIRMPEPQPAFQPTSTPSHFQHRFMLWNDIGIVRCFNTQDEKSIDVQFHDTTFHHGLHKNNYENYTIAALSNKVFAMVCPPSEDLPAKLTCLLLNSWDGSKEWSTTISSAPQERQQDDDEEVEVGVAVAAAGNFVAVASNLNNLKMFTYTGIQRPVISLPGPVVCLSGYDSFLMVVCHSGLGIGDSQNMCFAVFDVGLFKVKTKICWQPLPLYPKSTLKWAGFSDEGTPCCYDSHGLLRFYTTQWIVICDTKLHTKGKSDHYFVLGCSEKYQNVRCILCKGSYYPVTAPTPNVVEITFKLQLTDADSEKTINEELFWRNLLCLPKIQNMSADNPDCRSAAMEMEKILKQSIIKLFANACRSDADMRATDVASLMSDQPLQIAVKYASKCGKMYLSEKLSKIKPNDWNCLNEEEEQRQQHKDEEDDDVQGQVGGPDGNNYYHVQESQDMFEEQQHNVPSSSTSTVFPFLANRPRDTDTSNVSPSNLTIITPPLKNPFKIIKKKKEGPRGLEFFNNYKPESKIKVTGEVKKTAKQTTIDGKTAQVTIKKKINFMQWFAANKLSLKEEYPDLSLTELTKVGMKLFREENNKTNEKENGFNENKKRKLENDEPDFSESQIKKSAGENIQTDSDF